MKVNRVFTIKTDSFIVGDKIKVKLTTGEKHTATAIKQEDDGILFIFDQFLDEAAPMNKENTTDGGYEKSYMRKHLQDVSKTLPDKILKRIVPFDNGDILRLLTLLEVCGKDDNLDDCDGQIPYFKERRNRIAERKGNEYEWMWTSTVASAAAFALVDTYGSAAGGSASGVLGVRPAFKIRNL